jgi:hypothetical protein
MNRFIRLDAVFLFPGLSPPTTAGSQCHLNGLDRFGKSITFSCVPTDRAAIFTIVGIVEMEKRHLPSFPSIPFFLFHYWSLKMVRFVLFGRNLKSPGQAYHYTFLGGFNGHHYTIMRIDSKKGIIKKGAKEIPECNPKKDIGGIMFVASTRAHPTAKGRVVNPARKTVFPGLDRDRYSTFLDASMVAVAALEAWPEGKLRSLEPSGRVKLIVSFSTNVVPQVVIMAANPTPIPLSFAFNQTSLSPLGVDRAVTR